MTRLGTNRFPRAPWSRKGYAPAQVDSFLDQLARALDAGEEVSPTVIRQAGFRLTRGGYAIAAVDRHLDLLEERVLDGAARIDDEPTVREDAAVLAASWVGPTGQRFRRARRLRRGYSRREVDAFVQSVMPALWGDTARGLEALSPDTVRTTVFHASRGGYDEGAVDDALDALVDVLLRYARTTRCPRPDCEPDGEPVNVRSAQLTS